MGGFTTGRKEIIDLLRQRSRPYLFSNSLAPGIIGASLEVFKMLKESNALHDKLLENVNYFRDKMTAAGFDIKPTQSAICAVMLYDAKLSQIFIPFLFKFRGLLICLFKASYYRHNINNRLCSQSRHCRTSDMVNRNAVLSQK